MMITILAWLVLVVFVVLVARAGWPDYKKRNGF
jgi:hypothetical protein